MGFIDELRAYGEKAVKAKAETEREKRLQRDENDRAEFDRGRTDGATSGVTLAKQKLKKAAADGKHDAVIEIRVSEEPLGPYEKGMCESITEWLRSESFDFTVDQYHVDGGGDGMLTGEPDRYYLGVIVKW